MNIFELLIIAIEKGASDLHLAVGATPVFRINGELRSLREGLLMPEDTRAFAQELLTAEQFKIIEENGELDFSYSLSGKGRFRVNAFKQRGSYALAFRIVLSQELNIEKLGIPEVARELSRRPRGLILVTGPTGSGKSTTLAAMIQLINKERICHIITLEDPIEYLYKNNRSIIVQREVGQDTKNFSNGLRAALRQDPDVILVGEMRDLETISIAITAAETGHLVLSTLHTGGAAQTIERIIDVFPPYQQQQVRIQLAAVLEGIFSQQLLMKADGTGRVAAFEIMLATPAIRSLIRESKYHQMDNTIQTGKKHGMQTMDHALLALYRKNSITKELLLACAYDQEIIKTNIESHLIGG